MELLRKYSKDGSNVLNKSFIGHGERRERWEMGMITKVMKLRLPELVGILIIQCIAFLVGTVILHVVMHFDPSESFEIATLLAAMIVVFVGVAMGMVYYERNFNLAISMGVTRKDYITGYILSTIMIEGIAVIVLYIMHWIEKFEIRLFYSASAQEVGIEKVLDGKYVLPIIILFIGITVLFGALAMRFGKKIYVIIYFLWIMMCILPGRLSDAYEEGRTTIFTQIADAISNIFRQIPQFGLLLLPIIVSIICMCIAVFLAKKQSVERF